MPDFIVNSVSPTHEQSNHSNINHFEQVFHSLIANNLSPIWAFPKKTQVHCSKNVITREKIVETAKFLRCRVF